MTQRKKTEGEIITLEQFFKENKKCALGFSGGVDSSYLLYTGNKYGAKIKAYFVKTAFQPDFELRDARKIAENIGVEITVIKKNILDNAEVISNPSDRCYFCKRSIFTTLHSQAVADGIPLIIDGTNASDDISDRPGMKALNELSVRSPLRECGITKDEIRCLSKEAGLFTWDKPAYACLATRVPTGMTITHELLQKVEKAEDVLFSYGFSDFRVRVVGNSSNNICTKLQLPKEQINNLIEKRQEIVKAIKLFFPSVLLDLEGRNE
ncbi:MAG: ATP-dependent sacrificial sulfur transferase LarE [Treponema sp.]|nr:ATP-dependent sacrificial sulfur transferase LarE [Treponema sp.]